MSGKLRNMTAIYLLKDDMVLLLYRQGGKVVNNVWTGSAGGHFEEFELNDAKACVLRELNEELDICENDIDNLALRYVALRKTKEEIRQNYYFAVETKLAIPEFFVGMKKDDQYFWRFDQTVLVCITARNAVNTVGGWFYVRKPLDDGNLKENET